MRQNITITAAILLIILLGYTGVAKLTDFASFRSAMQNQEIPLEWGRQLAWAIPLVEIFLVGFLLFEKTRIWGFMGSLALLSVFSTYVGLIWIGSFPRVPCGCAGIFDSMSWGAHLVVNLAFVAISAVGIYLSTTMPGEGHQESGDRFKGLISAKAEDEWINVKQ
ncbi:MauE/DoxX family redox-associated membrane protein [Litoribacter populi]|uniref:MauE/DoxX family redox-associated membrane protein n=1 Tax=Litoribacter populi TaxID=2598460 RepID=UPI00117CABD6|nr:MauE/DoxX family redox-associated membrane protein [Litoribacter populi]